MADRPPKSPQGNRQIFRSIPLKRDRLPVNGRSLRQAMHRPLNRILFLLAAAIVLIDAGWLLLGGFAIDWRRYALLALLMLPLVVGAV